MARTRSQPMSPGSYVSLDDIPSQRRATRSVSAQPEESQVPQTASEPKVTKARRGSKARGGMASSRAKATRGRKKSVRQSARTAEDEVAHQAADQTGLYTGESDAHAGSPHNTQDTEAFEHTANLSTQPTSESVLPSVEKNDVEDAQVPNAADTCESTHDFPRSSPVSPRISPTGSMVARTPSPGLGLAQEFAQSSPSLASPGLLSSPNGSINELFYTPPERVSTNEPDLEVSQLELPCPLLGPEHLFPRLEPRTRTTLPETPRFAPPLMPHIVPDHLRMNPEVPNELDCGSIEHEAHVSEASDARSGSMPICSGPKSPLGSPNRPSDDAAFNLEVPGSALASPIPSLSRSGRHSKTSKVLTNGPDNGAPLGRKRKAPASPMTPSHRTPRRSRTVKTPQQTPFRQTRIPYAQISQQRRDEASGQLTRTLFQFDKLVAPSEIAGGGSITANPAPPQVYEPRTPMTAPVAGTDRLSHEEVVTGNPTTAGNCSLPTTETNAGNPPASAGLVKSFFNDVTRRWTTLRGRITGNQPADAQTPAAHPANVMPAPSFPGLPATSQAEIPSPNSPAPSMTPSRPYSLYPSGLDPELKARCFERSVAKTQTEPAASSPAKRKREASPPPMKIPNPPGCSYGMDLDYFCFTDEEIEEEERRQAEEQKRLAEEQKRSAEEQKRLAEEAEHAEAGAPSLKKHRTNSSYPTQRSALREKARTPAKSSTLISPSKQPGFNRNPRRTYAPPELETILSSGLFLESDTDIDPPATTVQNPPLPQTATDSSTAQPAQPWNNPFAYPRPPSESPYKSFAQLSRESYEAREQSLRNREGPTQGPGPKPNPHMTFGAPGLFPSIPPSPQVLPPVNNTRFKLDPHGIFRLPEYAGSSIPLAPRRPKPDGPPGNRYNLKPYGALRSPASSLTFPLAPGGSASMETQNARGTVFEPYPAPGSSSLSSLKSTLMETQNARGPLRGTRFKPYIPFSSLKSTPMETRNTPGPIRLTRFKPNPRVTFGPPWISSLSLPRKCTLTVTENTRGPIRGPGSKPNPHGTFRAPGSSSPSVPSSPKSLPPVEITRGPIPGPGFRPNPHGTFKAPSSDSDIEMIDRSSADFSPQASEPNHQVTQPQPQDPQTVSEPHSTNAEQEHTSTNGTLRVRFATSPEIIPPSPGSPQFPSMRETPRMVGSQDGDQLILELFRNPDAPDDGNESLRPPYYLARLPAWQPRFYEGVPVNLTPTEVATTPPDVDPLDEPPEITVKFNPDGTLADDDTAADVSDSEEASPLTRARTKAEQFKPKTPSRLRESHRFSSSMTRSSPSTPNKIDPSATGRSEPKSDLGFSSSMTRPSPPTPNEIALGPENHTESESDPEFRYMEDMEEKCDAKWLYDKCPSGDLRHVKLPKKVSLLDQIRSHGVDLTDEDIQAADEMWNNPVQRQSDMNAMRTVLSTAMSNPPGAPIDLSAWDSRPQ